MLTVGFLLALGVSSLLGSRSTSIGVLLAWQLAVAPLLLQSGKLDTVLVGAALKRIEPGPATYGSRTISRTRLIATATCF